MALADIMRFSDIPLVDMSKFPFFGGKQCHALTASLGSFAFPGFAMRINRQEPLLAAAWKSFNEEFNQELIHPDKASLFKGSTLDWDESMRFATYRKLFEREG